MDIPVIVEQCPALIHNQGFIARFQMTDAKFGAMFEFLKIGCQQAGAKMPGQLGQFNIMVSKGLFNDQQINAVIFV